MTYLQFHFIFLLPPLLLLLLLAGRSGALRLPRARLTLLALPAIALLYTTPWDNYLVARGIWSYGEDRVLATIGWVPVEEYLFFVLQPLLMTCWLLTAGRALLAPRATGPDDALAGGRDATSAADQDGARTAARTGLFTLLAVAAVGAVLLVMQAGVYLGLILVWAAPVLALQWWLTADVPVRTPRAYLAVLAPPTVYLWLADAVAIRLGIWHIHERTTVGLSLAGLPLEEAVFFLATNLLSLHGALLLMQPERLRGGALALT